MPRPSFDALFAETPPSQARALQRFWLDHSHQERVIGNVRWRYLRVGQGRRVIVLLPHALAPADQWFHLAGELAHYYRCLIPDGYALQRVFDVTQICETLVRMVEVEGAFSVAVIAHGSGGSVAQFLLQRYPHRVQHLVLSNSVALERSAPMPLSRWRWLLDWAPWGWLQPRLSNALDPEMTTGGRWSAFARAYLQLITQGLSRDTVQQFMRAEQMMRLQFEGRPTLEAGWPGRMMAVASSDDPLSYDSLELFRARYPRCEIAAWDSGGHLAPLQYPEHLAEQVLRFLAGDASGGPAIP